MTLNYLLRRHNWREREREREKENSGKVEYITTKKIERL